MEHDPEAVFPGFPVQWGDKLVFRQGQLRMGRAAMGEPTGGGLTQPGIREGFLEDA